MNRFLHYYFSDHIKIKLLQSYLQHNYNFRCFLDLNGFHETGVSSVTDMIFRPPIVNPLIED